MRLLLFISFLCAYVTASSQVFWSPVWMKESVRMTGLTGTGNYLYINAAGQLSKVAGVGAAGVTGLSNQQILYGKSDGTIDQEAAFTYDESINFLNMTNGVIFIDGTGLNDLTISESGFSVQEFAAGVQRGGELTPNYLRFDLDGFETYIYRTSGGSDYNLYLPNAQGGAGTFLKNDGSGNLSWSAETYAGTVTSVALAAGTSGTDVNITGSPITGSGTITLNIPDASTTARGLVTTGAQDIAGAKTFTSNILFEGTADANETTLAITDPTADNTVTVQDITGTIPMAVGTPVSLVTQGAVIGSTSCYSVPVDGLYMICWNATVTRAATSSSTLGSFQVAYTEATDNVLKTFPTSQDNFDNATNANTTGAAIGGVYTVHAKAGSTLNYIMGYSSSGATSMQYNLEITVIKIR